MFTVQRAITIKVHKPELRFKYSAHCLMEIYICVKFCEKFTNSFKVMERTQVHSINAQRAIPPKVGKPELRFIV